MSGYEPVLTGCGTGTHHLFRFLKGSNNNAENSKRGASERPSLPTKSATRALQRRVRALRTGLRGPGSALAPTALQGGSKEVRSVWQDVSSFSKKSDPKGHTFSRSGPLRPLDALPRNPRARASPGTLAPSSLLSLRVAMVTGVCRPPSGRSRYSARVPPAGNASPDIWFRVLRAPPVRRYTRARKAPDCRGMAGGRFRDPAGLVAPKLLAALTGRGGAYRELYLGRKGPRLHVGVERSKRPRPLELRLHSWILRQ